MRKYTTCVFALVFALVASATADPLLTFAVIKGSGGVPDLYLYVLDVGAGGEPIDITPPDAKSASLVWSPDGSRLLFASLRDGDPGLNYDLYTMDRNGGDLQRLTETPDIEFDPAWSPDGRKIAYFIGNPLENRSLWILDLNSGVKRELVPLGGEVKIDFTDLAWSPDGQQIAFNASAGGTHNLYTVHVDTKQLDLLHKGLWGMGVRDWLPTGELLVQEGQNLKLGLLSSNGEFEILFPKIQEKLAIQSGARSPLRRPDLFVFVAAPVGQPSVLDIYRVKRDGTGLQQLTNDGSDVQEYSPDLYTDSLDVPTPAEKLATSWAEVKAGRIR